MSGNVLDQVEKDVTTPVFLQIKADELIHVDPNAKLIKAKDYANYYDASLLLKEARNTLEKSKIDIAKLKSRAENDAYQEGVDKANELLAKTNIETALVAEEHILFFKEGLPDIILNIIRKFIHDYDDVDFLMHTINSSIKALISEQKIELHVSDLVFTNVKNRLDELDINPMLISLVEDSNMAKKDCLVVTPLGIINANLEMQLKNIELAVRKGFSSK